MIIDRNIHRYIVFEMDTIRNALARINDNEGGIIFCVDEEGVLVGVLTDGDFRRWAIAEPHVTLDKPVGQIANHTFATARITDSGERIQALLNEPISYLPLLDANGRCVALARHRKQKFRLGRHVVGTGQDCFIIAEIGNNHNGSLELAKRLVDEAIASGADCAKFQMRDLAALYSNSGNANDAREDLGSQYTLDLLTRFQLPPDDMFRVFDYCHSKDIQPLCTPWDIPSFEALERYGVEGYKVASADLTNHDLLDHMARVGKPLICSTGMSTEAEIKETIEFLRSRGSEFALLHCNSTYPAPFKDINLRYLEKLRGFGMCPVGYSSHERGINVVVAAVTLGADIIEKHFTLDRTMEGNDHRVSLLPAELAQMVEAVRQTESALGTGGARRLTQGEMMNRESLGKSLFVTCDLNAGDVIEDAMLEVRSPGRGLAPNRKRFIVGTVARRPMKPGDMLYPSDVGEEETRVRQYSFKRPFGIPIRYHDLATLGRLSNFDFLEFHLSYKDLGEDIAPYFHAKWDMDLVVHAPELFDNDHIMDLCSLDPEYRKRSIRELGRVVAVTRRLHQWFGRATRPRIIINAGGFTQNQPLPPNERAARYAMIGDALTGMDLDGVEIIPQTMPPYPWHFGGQRYQNLFMDPDETREFCDHHGYRVCLDTSHSKLACNTHKWSFTAFLQKVGPVTAHLHIADALGVDGEGLQVGDGDIDFAAMSRVLNETAPGVSFIPEIWQGHKFGGQGFWRALERLEPYL